MPLLKKLSKAKQLPVELVKQELKRVEAEIIAQVQAFDKGVQPYMDTICSTNGKRIRPVLAIMAGGATGGVFEEHIKLGMILELIHMASLVHDDIIDEAATRRKVATANAQWGNGMAVLLGDALFAHALMLATDFDNATVCRKVGLASRAVCEGEIIQTQRRFDLTLTIEDYFQIVEMKTGALFAAATELSAILSKTSEQVQRELYEFGLNLGSAYQIYDDCIDLVGSEEQFGKTLRTDLEKGKLTLPMLYLMETATPEQQKKINQCVVKQQALDFDVLVGVAESQNAVSKALDTAIDLLTGCRNNLHWLEESAYRQGFEQIVDFLESLIAKCR